MPDSVKDLTAKLAEAKLTPVPRKQGEADEAYAARLSDQLAEANDKEDAPETVDVPIYESYYSNHHFLVTEPDPDNKGQRKSRQPFIFKGAHRGFGMLRLDKATLFQTFPDIFEEHHDDEAAGMAEATKRAVRIIESSSEFVRGKRPDSIGKSGAIWKQSNLAVVKTRAILQSIRAVVAQYNLDDCRTELKRRNLPVPQKSDKETDGEYLVKLQEKVYDDMSGGAAAAPGNSGVTSVQRGTGTRGTGPS